MAVITQETGFSRDHVSSIEQGHRHVTKIETLKKFADALQTSPQFLLPREWLTSHASHEDLLQELSILAPQIGDRQFLQGMILMIRSHLSITSQK